ncbi:MFS transporter (plasmid) [Cupriavidus basilensis]
MFAFWAVANIDKVGISVIAANAPFLHEMGISGKAVEIGWLMSAFTLSYGLSSVLWGYIVDRIGPRKTALAGIMLWAVSLIIAAFAHDYKHIILSRVILGLGEGVLFPVTNKYIANWFHPRELGKAQASWVYGNYLGPALGLPVLVWILSAHDWHVAFMSLAALALVINLPLIYFMTRDIASEHPKMPVAEINYVTTGRSAAADKTINPKFYLDRRYWQVCMAFVMVAALFYGISFWTPTYLQIKHGMSPPEIKTALSLSWVFAVGAVTMVGILVDRIQRPASVGIAVFLVCGVALLLVPLQSHRVGVAAMLAIALGCTASQLLLSQIMLVKLSIPKSTGVAAGIIGLLNVAGGFATTLMGFIVEKTHGNYTAAFLLLALFPFVGAIAYAGLVGSERSGFKAGLEAENA